MEMEMMGVRQESSAPREPRPEFGKGLAVGAVSGAVGWKMLGPKVAAMAGSAKAAALAGLGKVASAATTIKAAALGGLGKVASATGLAKVGALLGAAKAAVVAKVAAWPLATVAVAHPLLLGGAVLGGAVLGGVLTGAFGGS
jgi:hypothetical protein